MSLGFHKKKCFLSQDGEFTSVRDFKGHGFVYSMFTICNLCMFSSSSSLHYYVWSCSTHGIFRDAQASSLDCFYRLCWCWLTFCNPYVVCYSLLH